MWWKQSLSIYRWKKNRMKKGAEPTWRLCWAMFFVFGFPSHGNSFSSTWKTQKITPESPPANHHYLASTARVIWDDFSMTQRVWNKCCLWTHFKEGNQGLNRQFATKKQNMAYSDLYIYTLLFFVFLMDHASGRYFFEAVSVSGNMQHNACVLWLLMEEIRRSPVELGSWDPNIDKVFIHPRWLFGISEPSTVVFLTGTKNIAPIGMTSNHLFI